MHRRLVVLIAPILWAILASAGTGFTGRVVGVTDGDIIQVFHDGKAEEVRLWGIDCPEGGQAFSRRAKQATSGLAFGKMVQVYVKDADRYGQTVAEVILPDGRNLNRHLVRVGVAWWFRQHAPHDRDLERLEAEAREARRGLWADPVRMPPWEWRKERAGR